MFRGKKTVFRNPECVRFPDEFPKEKNSTLAWVRVVSAQLPELSQSSRIISFMHIALRLLETLVHDSLHLTSGEHFSIDSVFF